MYMQTSISSLHISIYWPLIIQPHRAMTVSPTPSYLKWRQHFIKVKGNSKEKYLKGGEKSTKNRNKSLLSSLDYCCTCREARHFSQGCKRHLVNHKDDDIIERISPAKNGYWKVKECTKPLGWQHHKI